MLSEELLIQSRSTSYSSHVLALITCDIFLTRLFFLFCTPSSTFSLADCDSGITSGLHRAFLRWWNLVHWWACMCSLLGGESSPWSPPSPPQPPVQTNPDVLSIHLAIVSRDALSSLPPLSSSPRVKTSLDHGHNTDIQRHLVSTIGTVCKAWPWSTVCATSLWGDLTLKSFCFCDKQDSLFKL